MANDAPTLRLHNTLTRSKDVFTPIDPANVRMYVCGPTVYDYAHIGNARPVIVFDVLFRLLRHLYGESHVTYVRNITDVDDKINARAARDFPGLPLNEAIRAVTEKTAAQFEKDVVALGCLSEADVNLPGKPARFIQPRATDNIEGMQTLIATLLQNGHAYVAEGVGEVLFDTASMADYGQLSKRPLDENRAGARVAVDAHKKNPADFVLWKLSSGDEPGWESPWGRGRPGWHIECSAMSERYLGQTFDIHGGGLDLIFPHHENEIAQSRCAHGTPTMANVWMHNGFVQVEGRKMSKSEGNFLTIRQVLMNESGEVHRLTMLKTHYRQPIDWTGQATTESFNTLRGWERLLRYEGVSPSAGEFSSEVLEALCDDLNSPRVVAALHDLSSRKDFQGLANSLVALGFSLNIDIDLAGHHRTPDHDAIDALVEERRQHLRSRNFAAADSIRSQIEILGIQLMDYKDPATGERRTKWEVKR